MKRMIVALARSCCCTLVLCAAWLVAGSPAALAATSSDVPQLSATGLGQGSVALDGPWQFHLGDNPDWASRSLDDATGNGGWEQLTADKPWGEQGHRSYTGYAWYRRHLHLEPATGASQEFSLLVPRIEDVYEVYWNGVLVGKAGKFPPSSAYPYNPVPQLYPIGQARDGVLAVRVWKAALDSFDTGLQGGFVEPPLVGSAAALTDRLLEARAASGELFSFERLSSLMQHKPNAEEATKAATDFGQEDDITVLTLTRLAHGETASTLLKAPTLVPA